MELRVDADVDRPAEGADLTGPDGQPVARQEAVASLLAPLRDLEQRPVDEHVPVFAEVHAALRDHLAQAPSSPR